MSTATADRVQQPSPGAGQAPGSGRHHDAPPRQDFLVTRRTLLALLASMLAIVPLKSLFSDNGWLVDVWLAMIVVIGPAALLRLRRPAGALDIWPGIILLVPWLTARYVDAHAWAGFIPTGATWHDLSVLMTRLHHTTRDEVAPVHTTVAVRLVICALLGLLAALIDLVAVVGRRGALAGVPLLVVYTVAGAVPRRPVSWVWFTLAAIGFLLLLALDAGEDLAGWGRRIRGRAGRRRRRAMSVATQRIAVSAVIAAVLLPLLIPGQARNLIADAFHGQGSGLAGFGGGATGSISPFAVLKGQLVRSDPVPLATIHMDETGSVVPFYLRVNVLSRYTADGWSADDHGPTEPLVATRFATEPPTAGVRTEQLQAEISITGLRGNAPIFAAPEAVGGLDSGTTWAPQDQILLGSTVTGGQQFTERFAQPDPTLAELRAAPEVVPTGDLAALTEVPSDFPAYARNLVNSLTAKADGPYARALAIQRYFADPVNGFSYDLHTPVGDSGSALVDFLKGKRGFCQQYAAAMAIMLRAVHIPARVVLGYMHDVPDAQGNFTITSADAHAWVEAYFQGVGWIPFDPTPAEGIAGGTASDLRWAPHQFAPGGGAQPTINRPNATGSGAASSGPTGGASSSNGEGGTRSHRHTGGGIVLDTRALAILAGVLAGAALALVPALVRWRRRRRRLLAARRDGDADALWAELSDTAVDLGYVWSPARSPRQIAEWLGRDTRNSRDSLRALAIAVEHRRYAAPGKSVVRTDDRARLTAQLQDVTGELRRRRSSRARLRATLWPASLVGGLRRPARRR